MCVCVCVVCVCVCCPEGGREVYLQSRLLQRTVLLARAQSVPCPTVATVFSVHNHNLVMSEEEEGEEEGLYL